MNLATCPNCDHVAPIETFTDLYKSRCTDTKYKLELIMTRFCGADSCDVYCKNCIDRTLATGYARGKEDVLDIYKKLLEDTKQHWDHSSQKVRWVLKCSDEGGEYCDTWLFEQHAEIREILRKHDRELYTARVEKRLKAQEKAKAKACKIKKKEQSEKDESNRRKRVAEESMREDESKRRTLNLFNPLR